MILNEARNDEREIYGVALVIGLVAGEGDAVACASSDNFKLFKSGLLIAKVPSRSSTCAHEVPSSF